MFNWVLQPDWELKRDRDLIKYLFDWSKKFRTANDEERLELADIVSKEYHENSSYKWLWRLGYVFDPVPDEEGLVGINMDDHESRVPMMVQSNGAYFPLQKGEIVVYCKYFYPEQDVIDYDRLGMDPRYRPQPQMQYMGVADFSPERSPYFPVLAMLADEEDKKDAWLDFHGHRVVFKEADKALEIQSSADKKTILKVVDGKVEITGDLKVTGSIESSGDVDAKGNMTAKGDMKAGTVSLSKHTHSGTCSSYGGVVNTYTPS